MVINLSQLLIFFNWVYKSWHFCLRNRKISWSNHSRTICSPHIGIIYLKVFHNLYHFIARDVCLKLKFKWVVILCSSLLYPLVQSNLTMKWYIYIMVIFLQSFLQHQYLSHKMWSILVLNLAQNILDLLFHGEPPSWYNPVSSYHIQCTCNHSFSPEKSCFANFYLKFFLCFALTF